MGEAERVGLNLLVSGDHERGRPLADAEGLGSSLTRLQQLLGTAQRYVEDVVVSHPSGYWCRPSVAACLGTSVAACRGRSKCSRKAEECRAARRARRDAPAC